MTPVVSFLASPNITKKINQTNILENFLGLELSSFRKGKSIYKIKNISKA